MHAHTHTFDLACTSTHTFLPRLQAACESAAAAARDRRTAEAELAAAQEALRGLEAEVGELAPAATSRALKRVRSEAVARAAEVLARARKGALDGRAAEEALRAMEAAAAPSNDAVVKLMGLRAARGGDMSDEEIADMVVSSVGGGDGGDARGGGAWHPTPGEVVRVVRMGGAPGTVVSGTDRSGGKVSVRVGAMTVELRLSDIAPLTRGGPGAATAAQRAVRQRQQQQQQQQQQQGGDGTAKRRRPVGAAATSTAAGTTQAVAIQTSHNTLDVRGRSSDEAASEVSAALTTAKSGAVFFVVHGLGTGRVKVAVLDMLRRHPRVDKVEEEEGSKGGCTVVYVKV
jgi:hypothetical protein